MWDLALRDKSLVDSRSNALLSSLRADLSAWQFIRKSIAALESTFSKGDSVLGEQCGSVAKITKETSPTASGVPCFVKGTNAKFANLPQFSQSSHSPTAKRSFFRKQATAVQGGGTKAGFFRTPRILEEENQAECEKSAANKKVDSSKQAHFLSLRDFALAKSWQSTQSTKADSRNFFTSAKQMDCHAIATALACNDSKSTAYTSTNTARNDSKNSPCEKVDSRIFHNSTKIERAAGSQTPQAAGFADDFVGCQGVGEGIYLGDNEQAHAADSRKSAAKPTPKPSKHRILGFDNNTKIERAADSQTPQAAGFLMKKPSKHRILGF